MTDKTLRVACFGDSLTEGYGLSPQEALPAVLEEMARETGLSAKFLNFGVSGETFGDGLERMDEVIESRPDAVILAFGANDCFEGDEIESIKDNASRIIEALQAEHLPILLVGISSMEEFGLKYKKKFDPIFKELADKYDLPLFPDILTAYKTGEGMVMLDGIHPTVHGVRAMAEALLPQVKEMLEKI